jgi:SPP1 gp7 family putative phage head morphogenesis protein
MLIEGKQMGDAEVSFTSGEKPKWRALREAINGLYSDLQRPLTRLEEQVYRLLGLPQPKAEAFRYTAAMRRVLDEALELYLAEIAGPDRTREGFVEGGMDADTPDGVLQQWSVFSYAVGLRHGADLADGAQTLTAGRQSPAVRHMLDSAFTRMSENGRLRLEGVKDEIHSILTSATAAGLGPLDTGRQLSMQFDQYKRYEFERLARTEAAFAAEAGSRDQMRDLGVTHVQWVLGSGACPICQSYAGKIIEIDDEENQPPVHPNDLCSTVPVTAQDFLR